jgi:hypothetical protein
MAAIFYDAVAASYPAVSLDRAGVAAGDNTSIAILYKGKNPGYAVGDKVLYKAVDGTSFNGPIIRITTGAPYAAYPEGWIRLWLAVGNPASLAGKVGGSIVPVETATVVKPIAASLPTAGKVVSASTILKGEAAGGTATPVAPALAVAKNEGSGMSKGFYIAAGVIAAFAAYFVFRGKKGK